MTVISCGKKTSSEDKGFNETQDTVSMNQITSNYDTLIRNVTIKGDTNAYDELFYGLIELSPIEVDSIIFYSRTMAEKFSYPRAYYDYLDVLCEKNEIEFDRLYNLDLTRTDEK